MRCTVLRKFLRVSSEEKESRDERGAVVVAVTKKKPWLSARSRKA
jgi:hypothetical protein